MRESFAAAVTRAHLIDGPFVVVILQWEIFPPHGGIFSFVGQFHDTIKRVPRFLLAFKDTHQQSDAHDGDDNGGTKKDEKATAAPAVKVAVMDYFRHGFSSNRLIAVRHESLPEGMRRRHNLSLHMPDGAVATETSEAFAAHFGVRRFDGVDNFLVAVTAGLLGDRPAPRLDLNIVFESAGREKK